MSKKTFVFSFLMILLCFMIGLSAQAAQVPGWQQDGDVIRYFAADEAGTLEPATGLTQIGRYYYLFDEQGVLLKGWQTTKEGYRYFRRTGKPGIAGRMYTGFRKVNGTQYYFDNKTGVVRVGRHKIDGKYYYFNRSTKIRERGSMITNKWVKYRGVKYYYGSKGRMLKNRWVRKTWYVGPDGAMLKDTITPDGYLVGSDGKKVGTSKVNGFVTLDGKTYFYDLSTNSFQKSKWKKVDGKVYYLDADGVRVTGWKDVGSYRYYFDENGVRQKGVIAVGAKLYYLGYHGRLQYNTKTPDGKYDVDSKGVCTRVGGDKPRILIIAGHGQGDPGAYSSWGQEANYTREFAKLIYSNLKKNKNLYVEFYKNGSLSYDCYQQQRATLGSGGANISSRITGTGALKASVKRAIAANPNIPDFTDFDYVLEVHFNAKVAKDPGGDGSYTGIGFYVNGYKSKVTLERNILNSVQRLGFKIWAGVVPSYELLNARVCQELGVSYGLLETAFIDDGDDMTFYKNNKNKMAAAVANSIAAYYK